MHKVIVLSGISIGTACGGQTIDTDDGAAADDAEIRGDAAPSDAQGMSDADAWVHEGPVRNDAGVPDADAWVHEGVDASLYKDAAADVLDTLDVWPHEGPRVVDGSWP